MKPLKNIRVVDFTTLLPGPLATLMLSDAGAEVIKIEKEGGEELRKAHPLIEGESVLFSMLNRGKKSIEIDLKNTKSYKKIIKLIKNSDVLIEQFRPGVMERLKLDWKNIKKINKKIVYCSITGYGQQGEKSDFAGHDLNYMAQSGLLSLSKSKDGIPVIPSTQIADIAGGTYPAVMNILLAIIKANRTGNGSYLDISMYENLIPLSWLGLSLEFFNKKPLKSNSLYLNGASPRYNIYRTSDKKYLAVGALEDKFWKNFCNIIKAPSNITDELISPDKSIKAVEKIIINKSSIFWKKKFEKEKNVCCTIVENINNLLKDKHIKSKGLFKNKIYMKKKSIPLIPTSIDKKISKLKPKNLSPELGEHNHILKKL